MNNKPNKKEILKRALIEIKDLRSQLNAVERADREPIAIIGMGCRFPGGADDPQAYWQLLIDGKDVITKVPEDRWPVDEWSSPDATEPELAACRWAGFLDKVDGFDASFFEISPREALSLDPQQRLLLEVTWEALEHAGQIPSQLMGSLTGVFIGAISSDYRDRLISNDIKSLDVYSITGSLLNMLAGRLSFFLGLQGPALSIDTACSSSLVAIHHACQSLRNGECNLALTGGINLILSPITMYLAGQLKALSPDGRCRTFDARANGFARGEGCGVIALKRLSDAQRDGDNILALIRGSAVNHDGRATGLTAPNVLSQQALLQQALKNAKALPEQIGYVETHGTGTSLGDPIEYEALREVLGGPRMDSSQCVLGAVKTNIGHLEGAAGVAGLIKAVLALRHEMIPRNLNFKTLNPRMSQKNTSLIIPEQPVPWPPGNSPRLAGISGFGLSGTNAHVILEEAPVQEEPVVVESSITRPIHLLTLSGTQPSALPDQAKRLHDHFEAHPEMAIADVAYSLATTRTYFRHRLAMQATSKEQVLKDLGILAEGGTVSNSARSDAASIDSGKTAFLFTGQGSQYAGMGKALYDTQPIFREALDTCAGILTPLLERPLLEVMFAEEGSADTELLNQTAYTQPALFALEYALYQLWDSWGLRPDIMLGHSVGELTAACVAGVFSLEDGLRLIVARGRLMQQLPEGGTMVSVQAPESAVLEKLKGYQESVSIAGLNGPAQTVISGSEEDVLAIAAEFAKDEIKTTRLTVSHAFHSPLMDPMLEEFRKVAAAITYHTPQKTFVSNVDGQPATEAVATADYWVDHVRNAVRFTDGMQSVHDLGATTYLEIGPHPTLLGMAAACLPEDAAPSWLPSLRKGKDDWTIILGSLSRWYVLGGEVDWAAFEAPYGGRKVTLPTYPWQRQRYWIDMDTAPRRGGNGAFGRGEYNPHLGQRLPNFAHLPDVHVWQTDLQTSQLEFLEAHRYRGTAVLSLAGFSHMSAAACSALLKETPRHMHLELEHPLVVSESDNGQLQLVASALENSQCSVTLYHRMENDDPWQKIGSGIVKSSAAEVASPKPWCPEDVESRCVELPSEDWSASENIFEPDSSRDFIVKEVWRGDTEMLSLVELLPPSETMPVYHLLERTLVSILSAAERSEECEPKLLLPASFHAFEEIAPPKQSIWVYLRSKTKIESGSVVDISVYGEDCRDIAVAFAVKLVALDLPEADPIDQPQSIQVFTPIDGETEEELQDRLQSQLSDIISKITLTPSSGIDINVVFQQLGMDSLMWVQFLREIERRSSLEITLTTFSFKKDSIRRLVEWGVSRLGESSNAERTCESSDREEVDSGDERPRHRRHQATIRKDTVVPEAVAASFKLDTELVSYMASLPGGEEIEILTAGSGPALVLLPPNFWGGTIWKHQVEAFSRGFQVVVVHYPGYGRSSTSSRFSLDNLPETLNTVLDLLEIHAPVNLVGWSLGGLVAQKFAIQYEQRVQTMTLVCTTSRFDAEDSIEEAAKLIQILKAEEDHLYETFSSQKEKEEYRRFLKNAAALTDTDANYEYGRGALKFDVQDQIGRLSVPILSVQGGLDAVTPPQYGRHFEKQLKNGRYHEIETGGHLVPVQNHNEFNKLLEQFLLAPKAV